MENVILPHEPTEEMLENGYPVSVHQKFSYYADMLAASPSAGQVSLARVESTSEAFAKAMGFRPWRCVCVEQRGLDCDCGDAMADTREFYEEDWARDDCRAAVKAVIRALGLEVEDD